MSYTAVLTRETVHARNWMICPRCDSGKVFTVRDRQQGAQCTYCDNRGEIPRCGPAVSSDSYLYSTHMERQMGA